MDIVVHLSSPLLSGAVRDLIARGAPEHRARLMPEPGAKGGTRADAVLVDCLTLVSSSARLPADAKVILFNIGMQRERLILLLRTHRIAGVISTQADFAHFRKALKVIGDGQLWLENALVRDLLEAGDVESAGPCLSRLTARERQVVALLCGGLSNRMIAGELRVCEQTVKGYLSRIFKRCGVASRAQLISRMLGQGL